ncbi:S8 family peptidase [Streptomyces sp. NPDC004787]|uniref:S8 family peptidase n=1 Tax=Streptomyces sp. NPDC004787 TaxID=3154291 RepID=UPI0033AFFC5C
MKKIALAVMAAAVAVAPLASAQAAQSGGELAPLISASTGRVAGEYIVAVSQGQDPAAVAKSMGVKPTFVYTGAFLGFAMKADAGKVQAIRANPQKVKSVSENKIFRAPEVKAEPAGITQTNSSWGLDRIDQRNLPLNKQYTYSQQASSVRAYVIDSGIDTDHPQFGGRAINMYSAYGGSGGDCMGHGTHVAGIIGSSKYGVAKLAQLRGVKVTQGCGTTSDAAHLLAGIDWVYNNGLKPAVVNMSIAGPMDFNVNTAATNLVNKGFFVAGAGGNDGEDACTTSPASAIGVMGVAASKANDQHWISADNQSAYGFCVDIYAPGVSIISTWVNSSSNPDSVYLTSGTSQATPFVAGAAAIIKANNPSFTPQNIQDWLVGNGTYGALTNVPWGTPNVLLYKGSL